MVVFAGKLDFFFISGPTELRISKSNLEANQSRGSWVMIGQTNRKTDKTNYKCIHFHVDGLEFTLSHNWITKTAKKGVIRSS